MKNATTYEDYLEQVPRDLKEEFDKISRGELLPQLYSDFPFKQIYNPDTHADRLTKLFQLIFQVDAEIISSLNGETAKASVHLKKTIVDVLAKLSNDGIVDFEMQDALQEFIVHRMNIYSSDMIMLQYSIKNGQKKSEISFAEIPHSYLVIFMKKSPEIFRESESFIHVKEERTDTGIILPKLSTLVYIELDKCLEYVRKHGYPEEQKELCEWLIMMADINAPEVENIVKKDKEKQLIVDELEILSQEKEVLIKMLADKYADIIRYSEWKQFMDSAKSTGEKLGREQGEKLGKELGKELECISLIRRNSLKKMDASTIANFLDVDTSYVLRTINIIHSNPNFSDEEVLDALSKLDQN